MIIYNINIFSDGTEYICSGNDLHFFLKIITIDIFHLATTYIRSFSNVSSQKTQTQVNPLLTTVTLLDIYDIHSL